MISKVNSQTNIQSMLETLRSHQAQASRLAGSGDDTSSAPRVDFGQSIQRALQHVNEVQQNSRQMVERYERGDNVPLTDVVLATQKSSLTFEATLQIRNKVLKAYEDILNMPV